MVRVAYNPHYNIGLFGLERVHPFDSRKYGRAWKLLCKEAGPQLKCSQLVVPRPVTREELLAVHGAAYLDSLRRSAVVAGVLEVPPLRYLPGWLLDWCMLRPMRWAVMGSLVAAQAALTCGVAVNLSGGYHHAKPNGGEGFCAYSDVALMVHYLRKNGAIADQARIAYVDLDAHQGNGVCYHFMEDSRVFLYDMYNPAIYPAYDRVARERIDCAVPLPSLCSGTEYLTLLRQRLPGFLDSLCRDRPPALAIYNAGTDVLAGDALGNLFLSAADVLERDLFVIEECRARAIPVVMLLSGGYSRQSYLLVAATGRALLEQDDLKV
jgi:histone deacetylase 11